jgi:Glyoxalase-like domain
MATWIDHIVLAAPTLDAGVAAAVALTGATPEYGGAHVGRGTHNALLSLGAPSYLEVIAPDPAQPGVPSGLFRLDDLGGRPQLVAFAVGCDELDVAVASLRAAGAADVSDPFAMSRQRPDGTVLSWRLAFVNGHVGGANPFLISWDSDSSPATDSPAGGRLVKLQAGDPDPGPAAELLSRLGVDVEVEPATGAWLRATIETATGVVELS